jgi:hypothetical protein
VVTQQSSEKLHGKTKGNKSFMVPYNTTDPLSKDIKVNKAIPNMAKEHYNAAHDGEKFRSRSTELVIAGVLFIGPLVCSFLLSNQSITSLFIT